MFRRNRLFLILPLLCLLAFPATALAEETARFLSIIDGDSMLVEYHGRSTQVRLIGIDAPEHGQEYGDQARAFAMRLCYGRMLKLEFDVDRKDRYGRLLAYVYCNGHMLNESLVRSGLALAVTYKPNTKFQQRLRKAQKEAKRTRSGFWLRGGLKETPYEWRKRHRR